MGLWDRWRAGNTNGAGAPAAASPSLKARFAAFRAPSTNGIPHKKAVRFVPNFFSPDGKTFFDLHGGEWLHGDKITPRNIYVASAYAYAAIRWRAWKYSEAPLRIYQETDEGDEALPDHPLQALLDEPAIDYDQGELLRLTRMYRDLTGMCLWHKEPGAGGGIARLTPYSGDEFTVQPDPDGVRIYGSFLVTTSGPALRLFPEEVVFFREIDPYCWDEGIGPAEVACDVLNLERKTREAIGNVFDQAGFRSVIVTTPPEWTPEQDEWDEFDRQIQRRLKSFNRGGAFLISGGNRVTPVSFSIEELVPDPILDRIEAQIASIFGVPAVILQYLVGLRNSPWSQMSEARRMAIEDTIEPMWRADEKTLTKQLLHAPLERGGQPLDPDLENVVRFDRSDVRGLEPDRELQARISTQNREVLTVNERRMLVGYDPLPDADVRGEEIVGLASRPEASPEDDDTGAALDLRATPRGGMEVRSQGTRRPRSEVLPLARALAGALGEVAGDVTIAGSLRRKRPTVADIDIVLRPAPAKENELDSYDVDSVRRTLAGWGRIVKGGARYIQAEHASGVRADVFLVHPPAQWGVVLAARTGPTRLWLAAKRALVNKGYAQEHGTLTEDGRAVDCPDEATFFSLAGLTCPAPEERDTESTLLAAQIVAGASSAELEALANG